MAVTDLSDGVAPTDLARSLLGSGVSISNVSYTGADDAAGIFTGGEQGVGISNGIVLSTGRVETTSATQVADCEKGVEGPNVCTDNSTDNEGPGDPDLTALAEAGDTGGGSSGGGSDGDGGVPSETPSVVFLQSAATDVETYDAAVLQFDVTPSTSTLQFQYVFGSEEYSEYANTEFDDVFGFYVDGTNCATVPGTNPPEAVSIDTINGGNPDGDGTPHNPAYFRDNDIQGGTAPYDTELDGLTPVLTCQANVVPNKPNHIKLAIADTGDHELDSAVFVRASSLSATSAGPTLGEQGGATNPSEHQTTCSHGDPVNCGSGTLWEQFNDLDVPGRGTPLAFTRTYSSANAALDGPLGFGWTDSYNMSLAVGDSGTVTIHQENGSVVSFTPSGPGSFAAPLRVLATLTRNPDGSYTFMRDAEHVAYNFSPSGQLESEVDRNGNTTSLAYSDGKLASVTDPAGRSLTFSWTGNHISEVTDPAGRTISFAYDAAGNLVEAVNVGGGATLFGYDAAHLLTTITNPDGGVTSDIYDADSRVVEQTDPAGRTTTWSYSGDNASAAGGSTTMTDPDGDVTIYHYKNLELASVTHAAGTPLAATTAYTYDPATLGVATVTDPLGHVSTYTYDADGNLLSATDPLARTTSYTYNAFDEPMSVTDPSGETTTYSYDARGDLTEQSRPLGNGEWQNIMLGYGDPVHPGDVTSLTDPDGNVSTLSYDADGNVVASTDPLGDTTTSTYDVIGRRVSSTSARGNAPGADPHSFTTTYAYDPFGDVVSTTDPLGHVSSQTFDPDGNVTSTTDANGETTTFAYDGDNEVTGTTGSDGSTSSYTYDANGNQTSQSNGDGQATTWAYDALGRVSSMTDPLGRVTTYGYDANGNPTRATDPRGVATTLGYDAASELTSVAYSDGTPSVTYGYNARGQRASMTDGTGETTYRYDALGRLVGQTDGARQTVTYGYDPAGNLTSLTYPNGKTVRHAYDAAGRLASVTDWLGNTTTFATDPDNDIKDETYGNGVSAEGVFNGDDEITSITDVGPGGAALTSLSYARDGDGRVTAESGSDSPQQPKSYGYTSAGRLGMVNAAAFTYDPAGNITKLLDGTTLSYDAADELVSSSTGGATTTYGFDAAGDRVSASGGPDTSPSACGICVLAPTGSGALEVTGAARVTSTGVIATDSSSDGAITVTGSAAVVGNQVYVAGGVKATGTAKVSPAAAPGHTADPLAVTPPVLPGQPARLDAHGAQTVTAQPGVYSSITVSGAATLTLAAGTYVLAGGDLNLSGSAKIDATGVMIYLACSSYPLPCAPGAKGAGITVSGAASLTVASASSSAIGSDPNSTAAITISGGASANVNGDVDAPRGTVSTTGNAHLAVAGTLAAARVSAHGSAQITDTAPSHTLPGAVYAYDAAHRLVSATGTSGTTTYAYDGDGLRASATSAAGTARYAWDVAEGTPLLLSDGTSFYIYAGTGSPIESVTADGAVLYYQHDQLGSTRLLTDASGAVVATYDYTPYGQLAAHTGTANTPLRWAGQYQDADGLYYLRNRYYDPATAQFLTVDPLVAITGQPYAYAAGDPLNATDPTGLACWSALAFGITKSSRHCWSSSYARVGHDVASGAESAWNGLGSAAGAVGGAVGEAWHDTLGKHWRGTLQTIGVIAGIAAAFTGIGDILDLAVLGFLGIDAEVLGGISVFSGFVALAADLPGCLSGDKAACVGAIANGIGALTGLGSIFTEGSEILSGLLKAKAFAVGAGATFWDWITGLFGDEGTVAPVPAC